MRRNDAAGSGAVVTSNKPRFCAYEIKPGRSPVCSTNTLPVCQLARVSITLLCRASELASDSKNAASPRCSGKRKRTRPLVECTMNACGCVGVPISAQDLFVGRRLALRQRGFAHDRRYRLRLGANLGEHVFQRFCRARGEHLEALKAERPVLD